MTTELDTTAPVSGVVLHAEQGTDMIARTAGQLGQAFQIAEAICGTQFAPQHFRGKPHDAAAAILYGSQVGLDPLTALQNLYVIGGKPALYARTMQAIVQAAGHAVWTEESTDDSVTVAGQRAGSEAVERVTWTIERAQTAGYTSNANYKKDPQAMLYARATGDVCRRIAPDALLGMAYTVEEMRVSTAAQEAQRGAGTQARRPAPRQGRRQAPTPASEGPVDWYARLDECETLDDLKRETSALVQAHGGKEQVPADLQNTINALWSSMKDAENGPVADETTGEIIEEQEN